MALVHFANLNDLEQFVGKEVAVSDWVEVTQERIDKFAEATGDFQWIHVDVERARKETPFGSTIAHGFLTLSLLSRMTYDTLDFSNSRMGLNYGCNRMRFTDPVPAGARIRARYALQQLTQLDGGIQMTWAITMEREGADKPCMVAEWLTRRYV